MSTATGAERDLSLDLGRFGPVWLDVSRLVSRFGRDALTGIDRVELAYLRLMLERADPHTRFLCRTTRGYLLFGLDGGQCLMDHLTGHVPPPQADLWSRLSLRGHRPRHQLEAALRRHALDRCRVTRLGRLLDRCQTGPCVYFNTGHANLSENVFRPFRQHDVKTVVLIHDLIPLTHPETVADGSTARFAARLERVRLYADLVISNSRATQDAVDAHWANECGAPPISVALLGVDDVQRPTVAKDPKSFVVLGTIEARKNHALLLDVWEQLSASLPPDQMPHLHIIGPVGWRVTELMARLTTHPLLNKAIFMHGAVPEAKKTRRLAEAQALLFPSLAEGFGYPPLEALALGTPVVVSDLPVLRETLGTMAVYLSPKDAYSWSETIRQHVVGTDTINMDGAAALPRWETHFADVGKALAIIRPEGRA